MKLNKREKKLIKLLMMIIVFTLGVVFLIQPMSEKADIAKQSAEESEMQYLSLKAVADLAEKNSKSAEEYKGKFESYIAKIPKAQYTEQAESIVVGLLKSYNIVPLHTELKQEIMENEVKTTVAVRGKGEYSGLLSMINAVQNKDFLNLDSFSIEYDEKGTKLDGTISVFSLIDGE